MVDTDKLVVTLDKNGMKAAVIITGSAVIVAAGLIFTVIRLGLAIL